VGKSAPLKQNMEAAFRFEHQILLYNTCESRVSSKWSTLGQWERFMQAGEQEDLYFIY